MSEKFPSKNPAPGKWGFWNQKTNLLIALPKVFFCFSSHFYSLCIIYFQFGLLCFFSFKEFKKGEKKTIKMHTKCKIEYQNL
jgi:hypothetical protein